MLRSLSALALVIASTGLLPAAEKYSGPRPPKADIPYLVHADNLVPTEVATATQEDRKDANAYVVKGSSSEAKTPLAEPIFLIKAEKLAPEKLAAFRMEVRNGNREVVVPTKRVKNPPKPIPLKLTKLDDGLYRLEVDNPLENGEYSLSPDGSNDVYAFQIY